MLSKYPAKEGSRRYPKKMELTACDYPSLWREGELPGLINNLPHKIAHIRLVLLPLLFYADIYKYQGSRTMERAPLCHPGNCCCSSTLLLVRRPRGRRSHDANMSVSSSSSSSAAPTRKHKQVVPRATVSKELATLHEEQRPSTEVLMRANTIGTYESALLYGYLE